MLGDGLPSPPSPYYPTPSTMLLSTLFLTAALSASPAPQEMGQAPIPSGDVLTIDGQQISAEVYLDWLIRLRGEHLASYYQECWLLARETAKLGVQVSRQEVLEFLDAQIQRRIDVVHGGDRSKWVAELTKDNRNEGAYYRTQLIENELMLNTTALALRERRITEEQLRAAWEMNYGENGRTLDLLAIRFKFQPPPAARGGDRRDTVRAYQEARENLRKSLVPIQERAQAGEDFGDLAERLNTDEVLAGTRGELPGGYKPKNFSPDFRDGIRELKVGDVSAPIFAMGDYWIVKLTGERMTPFEDVKQELRREIEASPPGSEELQIIRHEMLQKFPLEIMPELSYAPEGDALSRPADEIVMIIDGVPVRRGEYSMWLMHYQGETMAPLFVEAWAAEREFRKLGGTLSDERVLQRVLADIELRTEHFFQGERERWLANLAESGITEESYIRSEKVRLRSIMMLEDLLMAQREITPRLVRGKWLERYGENGRSFDLRAIRLVNPMPAPGDSRAMSEEMRQRYAESWRYLREQAEQIIERLDNGEDFAALAERFSGDPSAERGGLLGEDFRVAEWPSEIIEALLPLGVGDVTEPIESNSSIWIFEVLDTKDVPLESVAESIRKELESARPTETELAGFRNTSIQKVEWKVLPSMFE